LNLAHGSVKTKNEKEKKMMKKILIGELKMEKIWLV